MNTSNQSYKELSIPYFKEIFEIVDRTLLKNGVPYYLIGATAIALELLKDGIKPSRGTKDIDFAIMLSTIDQYDNIIFLLEEEGFNKVKAPWTLYHQRYNVVIDLLPFGEIEENNKEPFNRRYPDLHVLGFKEILESSEEIRIDEITIRVPPLPGMILLKLVAWSDRPEERDTDLFDIINIIHHFHDLAWEEIVEQHHDLFTDSDFDNLVISARVLGGKSREYLVKSIPLTNRVMQVLEENLQDANDSKIARQWARLKGRDVEYMQRVLSHFKMGLME
jgi:predicted nucleotidyltransferase